MSKLIIIIGSSSLTQAYLAYYPSFHPSAYSISLLTYHETLSLACHQTSQQTLQPTSLPTYYPRSQHNVPSTFHLTLHSTSYPNAHPTTYANLTQHLTRPLTGPPIIPFTRCNHCFHTLILDRFHKFLIWFDLMFIITWEDKPKPVSHFWVTRLIRNNVTTLSHRLITICFSILQGFACKSHQNITSPNTLVISFNYWQ